MKESDKVIGEIRQELGSRRVKESGLQGVKESGSMEVKESGSMEVKESGSMEVKESGSMEVKESGSQEVNESGRWRVKKLQSWRGLIEAGDEMCCGAAQKEGFRICADYMVGRLMKMPVYKALLQVMEWNATREKMG
jgi:hypothetical protein